MLTMIAPGTLQPSPQHYLTSSQFSYLIIYYAHPRTWTLLVVKKKLTPVKELPNSQNATSAYVCTTSATKMYRKITAMAIYTQQHVV